MISLFWPDIQYALFSGTLLAAVLGGVFYFFRKNLYVITIAVLTAMLVEFMLYHNRAFEHLTLPRSKMHFNEYPSGDIFRQNRRQRLSSSLEASQQFRYFRPALYKEHTVFHGSHSEFKFEGTVNAHNFNDYFEKTFEKDFFFYKEFGAMSVKEFVLQGLESFEKWPREKKLSFLYFLELLRNDLLGGWSRKIGQFYEFPKFSKAIGVCLNDGYQSVLAGKPWQARALMTNLANGIFKLDDISYDYAAQTPDDDYRLKAQWAEVVKLLHYVFELVTVDQFLISFRQKYLGFRNTSFVMLYDYADFLYMIDTESGRAGEPAFENILHASAVTAPILRFYPGAYFAGGKAIKQFFKSGDADANILYIESEHSPKLVTPPDGGTNNALKYSIVHYDANTLIADVETESSGYLYYADTYDRYWRAYVNGAETRIHKANLTFKAIDVPRGKARVKFVYRPVYFKNAMLLYYLAAIICGVYFIYRRTLFKRRNKGIL